MIFKLIEQCLSCFFDHKWNVALELTRYPSFFKKHRRHASFNKNHFRNEDPILSDILNKKWISLLLLALGDACTAFSSIACLGVWTADRGMVHGVCPILH